MSRIKPLLNWYLRRFEKPYLTRAANPEDLRKSFDRKAKFLFHGPREVGQIKLKIADLPALELTPRGGKDALLILYFHGGAYVFGSPSSHSAMVASLCKNAKTRAILPAYRKAPEHRFPVAIDDALAVWDALLERGEDPKQIILGGDSAGGGLALALLGVLLARGQATPLGAFAFSPLTDLTFTAASISENAKSDVVLPAHRAQEMADMYLAGADPKDPRASPICADFKGAPPIWLTVSDTEILFEDTTRLSGKLTEIAVPHELTVESDLPHVWTIFHNTLPEARKTLRDLGDWIRQLTGPTGES